MHGRGVATLLLEHLVSLARQHNLTAFEAETLPDNLAMQRVFADAGLPVERHFADGLVELMPAAAGHDSAEMDSYLDAVGRPRQPGRRGQPSAPAPARVHRGHGRRAGVVALSAGRSCTTSSRAGSPGRSMP